jgi:predicted methyltransferase
MGETSAPPADEEFEIVDDMGDMNQDPNKSASSQDRILLSQVDKKKTKKINEDKINDAVTAFFDKFDEYDLPAAGKLYADICAQYILSPGELHKFASRVFTRLQSKGISLDAITV